MVLTYSMVLGRLDTLNHREQQVRQFYKPLPAFDREKPYPHRHRFADVLEPGDVVRTIDKGGDEGGWDEGVEGGPADGDGEGGGGQAAGAGAGEAGHHARAKSTADEEEMRAMRENRTLGPGRDSQKLVTLASKKERQLRKAIDSELNVRKETLKSRLYSEAGVAMEGEDAPRANEQDKIDPLFKVGKAQMMFPKPTVHKTGEVTGPLAKVEQKLGESGPRFTSGAVYKPKPKASGQEPEFTPVAQEQGKADAEQVLEDNAGAGQIPRTVSVMSSVSARSGLNRVNSSGVYSAQEALREDEDHSMEYSDEDDSADIFQGPVSTWGYRKSVYSEHDDPSCREFYYTQLTLPPAELEQHPAEEKYLVRMKGLSFDDQPEHTCIAAGRNEDGKLLFGRAGESGEVLSSILSAADEIPWVTVPIQLKGHQIKFTIYRRGQASQENSGEVFVSERVVTFRPPTHLPIPAYPAPPTSAPEGMAARSHGRQALAPQAGAAAARPGTAPAVSPSKDGGRGSPSPGRRSPKGVSPTARWNTWAESGGAEAGPMQNPMVRELSQENKSFEESPAARKKKELARMRQQMRASLQQTQSQVLASMGGAGSDSANYLGGTTGGGANGAHLAAPMQIVSKQSSSPTNSRPTTSSSVRFR